MTTHPTASRRLVWLALAVPLLAALAGCDLGGGSSQGAALTTPGGSKTATPLVIDGVPYTRYADPTFGFSLEIPKLLTVNGRQSNSTDGGGITAMNGTYPDAGSALELYITTATKGVDPATCQTGTPVPIGQGLNGYQVDTFSAPTPPPMPNSGAVMSQVSASVVENGVLVGIDLVGMPPDDTFMQRYGSIWHEMLSSFTLGTSATPSATNNPCAG